MSLLEVGRIDRPHGVRGDVIVALSTDRTERVAVGAVLYADQGPLVVQASRPHHHRWIVTFEGVAGREAAEALHGQTLRAEPIEDPEALWVHQVVGAEVIAADGDSWGHVAGVLSNPASDLLELDDGTLVPIVFIVDDSGMPERLVIDPPAGLRDLGD
ncbi:MAG: rRNA processing protein RimM [Acidimicrobiales bacterium]|nr:rRNA processing protein RimM [Acidimicrobiales bacterium]